MYKIFLKFRVPLTINTPQYRYVVIIADYYTATVAHRRDNQTSSQNIPSSCFSHTFTTYWYLYMAYGHQVSLMCIYYSPLIINKKGRKNVSQNLKKKLPCTHLNMKCFLSNPGLLLWILDFPKRLIWHFTWLKQ